MNKAYTSKMTGVSRGCTYQTPCELYFLFSYSQGNADTIIGLSNIVLCNTVKNKY